MRKPSEESIKCQDAVYRYLRRFIDKPTPTNRDIAEHFGWTVNRVAHFIRQLKKAGYILPITINRNSRKIIFGDHKSTEPSNPTPPPSRPGPRERPVWTPEQKARAFELKQRGYSCRRIGEIMGKTRNSVIGMFYRDASEETRASTVRVNHVTLAKHALGEEARKKIQADWERLSA